MQKIFIAAILFLSNQSFIHAASIMEDEGAEKESAAQTTKEARPSQEELERTMKEASRLAITPLEAAIRIGSLPLVKYFHQKDPSLIKPENKSEHMPLPQFLQAILYAVRPDMADFLLEAGADINKTGKGIGLEVIPLVSVARLTCESTDVETKKAWFALFEKMLKRKAMTTTESGKNVLDEIFKARNAVLTRGTRGGIASDEETSGKPAMYDVILWKLAKEAPGAMAEIQTEIHIQVLITEMNKKPEAAEDSAELGIVQEKFQRLTIAL